MANKLQQYFPMLRERNEILKEIRSNRQFSDLFDSWLTQQQQEFLDFCCGAKGVKMLYDSFFKEILNPEYHPERLNDFLSCLLGMQVKVLLVLPDDSTRLGDENSLENGAPAILLICCCANTVVCGMRKRNFLITMTSSQCILLFSSMKVLKNSNHFPTTICTSLNQFQILDCS